MKKLHPSDPSLLREQLLAALQPQTATSGAEAADPWRFRSPLRLIVGEAWRCASRSDFSTQRALLRILIEAQEFVRPDLPEPSPPEVEAAREVHYAAWVLHVAEAFLRPAKAEARLRDRQRSISERKILRVLVENKERYLRRKEIQGEMEKLLPPPYPEATRISQILSDLWDERLLMRMQGSAQGNPQTSFFALSRQGLELCKVLGITEPHSLFEPDEAKWRHLLRRAELASDPAKPEGKEKIATFYRPRPGIGCSLALARCAISLAENIGGSRPLLILDLEGEGASLPDHLKIQELGVLRGLAGLIEDYHAQPEGDRRDWLESSMFDERYTCRVQGKENLFYLPAFQNKPGSDPSYAYAALLSSLRREIVIQPRRDAGTPQLAAKGFLGDLHEVLHSAYAKTLIQAPCGLGPGAYLACVLLAQELVLFLRPDDEQREEVRKVLREVVGTSLWRRETELSTRLAPVFVFSRLAVDTTFNPAQVIEHLLVNPAVEKDEVKCDIVYRVVRLYDDEWFSQNSTLPDLLGNRSLLGRGRRNLVEILHPDSSLIPIYYKYKDLEMEERRKQVMQVIQSPAISPIWRPVPTPAQIPIGQGHSYAASVEPVATGPLSLRWSPIPDRPSEIGLDASIEAALKNAEMGESLRKVAPVSAP